MNERVMNERVERDEAALAISRIVARAESIGRYDLLITGMLHAFWLLALFLAILILADKAAAVWPWLGARGGWALDLSRLALVAMGAVVVLSARRRMKATGETELELLRSDVKEIQQRMSHF